MAGPTLMELKIGNSTKLGLPIAWNDSEVVSSTDRVGLNRSNPDNPRSQNLGRPVPSRYCDADSQYSSSRVPSRVCDRWARGLSLGCSSMSRSQSGQGNSPCCKRASNSISRLAESPCHRPDFPLVGIVFRSQSEFFGYARSNNVELHPRTAGYYSSLTNRLYFFESDENAGQSDEVLETVLHEATHQIAFNCGIHHGCLQLPCGLSKDWLRYSKHLACTNLAPPCN